MMNNIVQLGVRARDHRETLLFDLTRRAFMAAVVAVPALTGLRGADSAPVLRGDGRHDDTLALRALFAGRKVIVPAGASYVAARLTNGAVTLVGGRFLTRDPVDGLTRSRHAVLKNVMINNRRVDA